MNDLDLVLLLRSAGTLVSVTRNETGVYAHARYADDSADAMLGICRRLHGIVVDGSALWVDLESRGGGNA